MKDPESAESKEKSNFRFFDLWSFCDVITPIFDEFFTITQKMKIGKIFYFVFHSIQLTPQKPDQNRGGGSAYR